ncbi:MAG: metal-dependent transcriptional regulator [Defluviitaleaceae bacterium]|nr:metal-dependent transcriptional regulator [Defluviitaleaceae bacterium]
MASQFYTFKGYALLDANAITASMEDYLEMAYRLHSHGAPIRVKSLAENLNVKPSSATKMVANLKKQGLATSERYGNIQLTPDGLEMGSYLVFRHDIIHDLLCHINQSANELEQVEKIEHFINPATVMNIKRLLDKLPNDTK